LKENFLPSLQFVLASEGGYSDHPSDRGGPTNQGITMATLKDYHARYGYGDFDHDGDIDTADILMLDTPDEAAPVYKREFWDRVHGDDLPSGLDYLIFDSAVNHGSINAGKFLQRALNRTARTKVLVDGYIGPRTLEAVPSLNTGTLIADVIRERDIFYRKIVACDASQECFFKGWMNRLKAVAGNVNQLQKG
jgi:lysozyme family protein